MQRSWNQQIGSLRWVTLTPGPLILNIKEKCSRIPHSVTWIRQSRFGSLSTFHTFHRLRARLRRSDKSDKLASIV